MGYPLQYSWASLVAQLVKNLPAMWDPFGFDLGLIPGVGRSPREEKGYPLQYPGLENSKDCIVHGVAKSRTQLSYFHFHTSAEGRDYGWKRYRRLAHWLRVSLPMFSTAKVFH